MTAFTRHNVDITENDPKERNTSKYSSCNIYQDVIDEGIRTGQHDDLIKFTEEVGDLQFCAEGQT